MCIYSHRFSHHPPPPSSHTQRNSRLHAGSFIPTARTGQLATSLVGILTRLRASLSRDVHGCRLMLCVCVICICSHSVLVLMLYLFSKSCHLKDIDVAYFTHLKQNSMTEVTERKKEQWMKTRHPSRGKEFNAMLLPPPLLPLNLYK